MQILTVSLKRFKSHLESYFAFELGTNAICGENGAGKTSILEAIAWVLFDHSPYTQQEMVRAGSESAEVAVQFISQLDERTYEVRRHTTTGYQIYDPQRNQRLEYERKGDILSWLRQHLGVPPGTDLERLFVSTIGVPQGTFTADFLKPPRDRKAIFDAVLKVEEYQRLFDDLRDLERHSKEQITQTEHALELLAVQLRDWDPLQAEQQHLSQSLAAQQISLGQQQQQLAQHVAELSRQQQLAEHLADLDQRLQQAGHQISLAQVQAQQAEQARQAAQSAQQIVEASQPGSEIFLASEQRLRQLEQIWQTRQQTLHEREALLGQDQARRTELARLQQRLDLLAQAAQEMVGLSHQVAEQEQLEADLAQIAAAAQELGQRQQELQLLRTRYEAHRQSCRQSQQALDLAEQAQDRCRIHAAGHAAYQRADQEQARLEQDWKQGQQQQQRREQVLAERHRLQLQQAELAQRRQRRQQLQAEIAALQPQIEQHGSLRQKQQALRAQQQQFHDLRLRLGRQEAEHEQQQRQLHELSAQIRQRQALAPQLRQIPEREQQLERIGSQISRVAAAQQFQQELRAAHQQGQRSLGQHEQQVQRATQTLAQLGQEFPMLRAKLDPLVPLLGAGKAITQELLAHLQSVLSDLANQTSTEQLQAQQQRIRQELQQLYPLRGLLDQLPQLEAQRQEVAQQIAALQEAIDDSRWELEAEATFLRQIEEVEAGLTALKDPLAQAGILGQELAAQPDLEPRWQQVEAALAQQQQQLDEIDRQMGILRDLEERLEQQRQLRQQQRQSYQIYLQAEPLAATLPQRQQEHQALQAELAQLEQQGKAQQAQLAQAEAAMGDAASLAARQTQLQQRLQALQDPRSQLRRLQAEQEQRPEIAQQGQRIQAELAASDQQIAQLDQQLAQTDGIDAEIQSLQQRRQQHRPDYERHLVAAPLAQTLPHCQQAQQQALASLECWQQQQAQLQAERDPLATCYDPSHHAHLESERQRLDLEIVRAQAQSAQTQAQIDRIRQQLQHLEALKGQQQDQEAKLAQRRKLHRFVEFCRKVYKQAGPRITSLYLQNINLVADRLFREILNRPNVSLTWESDYDITVQEGGSPKRRFALLSGGEQMSAALAVRLALLRVLGDLNIAFFDEPTANMDQQRRRRLAEAITNIRSFRQLFVISHDDTFEQVTENIIRVERREHGA